MLITKNFVVLNNPKTGSSFVRKALKDLYKNNYQITILEKIGAKFYLSDNYIKELTLPNIKMADRPPDQHGTYSQIPATHKQKAVLSIIRNPYDRFLSTYEFRNWERQPPGGIKQIKKIFPHFPDLSLNDYVDLAKYSENIRNKDSSILGTQTLQFMQMFFKEPTKAIAKADEDYFLSGTYKKDLGDIIFIRQEQLRNDLALFLKSYDFSNNDASFILNYPNVNVTNVRSDRSNLWTSKALAYVKKREKYLIKMLDDLGFSYNEPDNFKQ